MEISSSGETSIGSSCLWTSNIFTFTSNARSWRSEGITLATKKKKKEKERKMWAWVTKVSRSSAVTAAF